MKRKAKRETLKKSLFKIPERVWMGLEMELAISLNLSMHNYVANGADTLL